MDNQDLPMGFGVALLQNQEAAQYFETLTAQERALIVEKTHAIQSKQEMKQFVSNLKSVL
jgi:hypothetical protein